MKRSGYPVRWLLLMLCAGVVPQFVERAGAYVPIRWGAAGVRVRYAANRFPLAFQLNESTARGTGNVESGSDVPGALRRAMSAWQSIQTASIQFAPIQLTSLESTNSSDGINLITMVDTAANNALLGKNTLALTRLVFNPNTGTISETDIIFNSKTKFSTNQAPGTFDLQSVATHEIGHALGCDHAAAQSDTMFFLTGTEEFFQRYLSVDSVAFASFTYPNARTAFLGTIGGRVTMGGNGVFGASVTAMELDRNLVYTTLTEPDGSYTLTGPVPGRYALYAEPLDGPAPADALLVSGGDAYYKNINAGFKTVIREGFDFSGPDGTALPLRRSDINLNVPGGNATLNIDRMGRNDPKTGSIYLARGPVLVHPGEDLTLTIGGPETWKVSGLEDLRILGTGITLDRSRGIRVVNNEVGAQVGIALGIRVSPDALPGPRGVVLRVDDQQVVSTGGILVGMRRAPVRSLYMPYLQTSPEQYTGVALANPDALAAVVRIKGRDAQGALLYDENAIVPGELSIAAGAQTARLERQVFNLPHTSRQAGSISVESDSPGLQGFFLTGSVAGTFLDGAEAFTRAYRELYFVDVIQNLSTVTEIHLANVGETPLNVQLSLVGSGGNLLRPAVSRSLPPGGKIGEPVSSLFGTSETLSSAHVKAVAGEPSLVGFGLIRQADTVFGLNALPPGNASATLYSPQLAAGNFGLNFSTRINIVNIGDSPVSVALSVFGDNGLPVATPVNPPPAVIPGGGQLSLDARSYFGFTGATQGSVRIEAGSGGSKLVGNILFGDGDPTWARLNFGAALPLSSEGSKSFLFAQVAQSQGFYTGVAFMAPDGADLTIEVFREDGTPTGSRSLNLAPRSRRVAVLEDLIPGTRDQVRGFVKVTASREVIGFELFGSTSGLFLSAVPPQPLDPD